MDELHDRDDEPQLRSQCVRAHPFVANSQVDCTGCSCQVLPTIRVLIQFISGSGVAVYGPASPSSSFSVTVNGMPPTLHSTNTQISSANESLLFIWQDEFGIPMTNHSLVVRNNPSSPGAPSMLGISRLEVDRKSTRLNSSHSGESRMPSSA